MRLGRQKAGRRILQYYARTTGLQAPYTVLLDATFVVAACAAVGGGEDDEVRRRVAKILASNHQVTLFMTQSAVNELQELIQTMANRGQSSAAVTKLKTAQQWTRQHVDRILPDREIKAISPEQQNHQDVPQPQLSRAAIDFLRLAATQRYVVATVDADVAQRLGRNAPLLTWNQSVLLLQDPGGKQQKKNDRQQEERVRPAAVLTEQEAAWAAVVRREEREKQKSSNRSSNLRRGKRPAAGPNPLSCKKKKTSETTERNKRRSRGNSKRAT